MTVIEILPGNSIGGISLGSAVDSLPKGAVVRELDGEFHGISFTHKDGKVDDVWIDDLRKIRYPVRLAGRDLPHKASLKKLKELFGSCERLPGLKGGVAFTCQSGILLGCDFDEKGRFIEIRLLPPKTE